MAAPSTASYTRCPQGLALMSGSLGALASCFGKVAFSSLYKTAPAVEALHILFCTTTTINQQDDSCHWILMLVYRGLCLIAMIICNALMLGSFVQGMQESGSLAGTALANAANFMVSALMGWLFFQDSFTPVWWYGFAMVLTGAMMLSGVRATNGNQLTSKID